MRKVRKSEAKAKPKAKTRAEMRPMRSAKVESPYGLGHDRVQRVVDAVTAMHARRQIDDRQLRAAEVYRAAYDVAASAGGGTMGERSGGATRTTLSEAKIAAGETLNDAARLLGVEDGRIVRLVVGEGHSIAEVAGSGAPEIARRVAGERLRKGLDTLADAWHIADKAAGGGSGRTRSKMAEGARPEPSGVTGKIERGRVGFGTAQSAGFYDAGDT
ncbi:hypothetical protein SAMN02745157_1513 [Kaistia soli DSM 19436]|uniref:Uncharacterized protein n=1 Tax=Kaistia soli DSM 19436 TaxID=1122133 RepID=A0A1M4YGI4_9HYPH|nr:hypothetical protein [Kaistia soli]SHF04763.1 hypothetical protein SAMN02745157_1513 [Kaistia soli DSM 19436]